MVTLCLDFGNTRLKAAIFEGEEIIKHYTLEGDGVHDLKKIVTEQKPACSILSSVVHHSPEIETYLASVSKFHKLSENTIINFTTPVAKPSTIGADRLALMAAAARFYPGKNNLVIAMGSCVTYNFQNQYHEFLGGSITPGMLMRYESMHNYTALLPLVSDIPEAHGHSVPLIGYDTKSNLISGVLLGLQYELDGFIDAYSKRYGNFNAVLTGGNSAYFAGQLKNKIFADSNFLFKGLYALSELNNCS